MKFSLQTGCFYPPEINYTNFPDDIIDVSEEDFNLAMGRNPGDTLDVANGHVVIVAKPAPTLDELKQAKIAEGIAAFTNALAAGFMTTHNIKMDAELEKVQLLKSAYDLMALLNLTVMPILVDYDNNVHVNIPMTDVIAIIIEVGMNYQTLYAKKQTLRGQVMAANTEAALDLIAW